MNKDWWYVEFGKFLSEQFSKDMLKINPNFKDGLTEENSDPENLLGWLMNSSFEGICNETKDLPGCTTREKKEAVFNAILLIINASKNYQTEEEKEVD